MKNPYLSLHTFLALSLAFIGLILPSTVFSQSASSDNQDSADGQSITPATQKSDADISFEEEVLAELKKGGTFRALDSFSFYLNTYVGISAFPHQDVRTHLDSFSKKLLNDFNSTDIVSDPYILSKQMNVVPFYVGLDFRFFWKQIGFGIAYEKTYPLTSEYVISKADQTLVTIYEENIRMKYTMEGHGIRLGAYAKKSIYIPQLEFMIGFGYATEMDNLTVEFESENLLPSQTEKYQTVTHGPYLQGEILNTYKNFTYSIGVLFEGKKIDFFENDNGKLSDQNGNVIQINFLETPSFYLKIGATF